MGLSFEFQEQLRAIEESIKPVDLTSEISQFQDEIREGYMPEKKAAPDYGEPWRTESFNAPIGDTGDYEGCLEVYTRENQDRVAEAWNPEDKHEAFFARIVSCVNACAGMTDPASEIQALKQWKQEMMEVESSWNAQEVGRLLNVKLGQPIKASIQPAVENLLTKIQAMRLAIKEIYAEADAYADGASDASAHDKFCNEIAAKLKPFIKP